MIKLTMDEQDRLKGYIEKLESLKGRVPTEGELQRIQKDNTLGPDDLKKLEMLVERHNDRADIYLHRENINGAIEELDRAAQLAPRDPFLHLHLAKLFKNRYENFGFLRRDRLRAQDEAEKTILLDKSLTEANNLIKEMDLINKGLLGKTEKNKAVIIMLPMALLVLSMIIFTQRDLIRQWIFRTLNPPQEVRYTPPIEEFDPASPREIGVDSYDFVSKGLNLSVMKSEIAPINDHWGYTLQGGLVSSNQGINKAAVILRFLSRDYALLYEKDITLTNESMPLILPGENLPVDFFFFLPISPHEVDRISILPKDMELALPGNYHPRDKKVWWRAQKPEGVKLNVTEREHLTYEGYDSIVHFYTLDLDHMGMAAINDLEITLEWKGRAEEIKYTKILNPLTPHGPPMKGREQRALGFTMKTSLNEDWESLSYEIHISRIGLED